MNNSSQLLMNAKQMIFSWGIALCALCSFASPLYAHGGEGVVSETLLDKVPNSWDGKALEAYPAGKPAITMLRISVPPKVKLPKHYHSVINVGYMLQGELTVRGENGQSKTIKAGEPLIEMVGTIHYGENTGDTTAVIVVFYAGDSKTPITTATE